MRLLEKLGYGKGYGTQLRIQIFEWLAILFLIFGPVLIPSVDRFVTRLCVNMSTTMYTPWAPVIYGVAIAYWGFVLYGNYRGSRAPKFEMETTLLDPQAKSLQAEGKDVAWLEQFRWAYRRRQYISILTSAVLAVTLIMYYEIWIFFVTVTRRNISVMKGDCSALSFSLIEKIYLTRFLKDLPFSLAEVFNIYGSCRPNDDVLAIRIMNSLASSLHWALIIGVVGFIWGKQIKQWFLARA